MYIESAWLYDLDSNNRNNLHEDIPFYIDYARQQQGDILELGCGTGRVAMALAGEGFHVTGLDLSLQMLDIFREKLSGKSEYADKINLVQSNMASFSFDRKFVMIIAPFRSFQMLINERDVGSSLACIREHLTDDGIFIVNIFNTDVSIDEGCYHQETVQWEHFDEKLGAYIVKKDATDQIDTENQIMSLRLIYEVTYFDERIERIVENLKLKYYKMV